ncbi:MAG TPA: alpha/beta hydrolase, partial [Burkholderiales bacterium]|nr:alpha/beta hydrolase [Burkholderiales bacterium]
ACWLARNRPVGALVLASTFTSVPDMAAEVYGFLPVRLISRFKYDTRECLGHVKAPVLVVHSPRDDIIPYAHGRKLYESAREPKEFLEIAGGHNDGFVFIRPEWVKALGDFLDRARR